MEWILVLSTIKLTANVISIFVIYNIYIFWSGLTFFSSNYNSSTKIKNDVHYNSTVQSQKPFSKLKISLLTGERLTPVLF